MINTVRAYKLVNDQIWVVDKETGIKWLYTIEEPETLEFIKNNGEKDKDGNYVLIPPLIAAIQKWNPDRINRNVERYMREITSVMEALPEPGKANDLNDLQNAPNDKLEQLLLMYGGYRAYLEAQVAYIESKRSVLEESFEEGLARAFFNISRQNEPDAKRKLKEVMRGEAIAVNPQLKKIRQQLVELNGIFIRISGLRNGYKAAYDAISRVVALRSSAREQG